MVLMLGKPEKITAELESVVVLSSLSLEPPGVLTVVLGPPEQLGPPRQASCMRHWRLCRLAEALGSFDFGFAHLVGASWRMSYAMRRWFKAESFADSNGAPGFVCLWRSRPHLRPKMGVAGQWEDPRQREHGGFPTRPRMVATPSCGRRAYDGRAAFVLVAREVWQASTTAEAPSAAAAGSLAREAVRRLLG